MEEVRENFLSFAQLCKVPSLQVRQLQSVFPLLESVLSERLKVVPEDLPCFSSATAIACLIGKCSDARVSLIEATVCAISLVSTTRISSAILQVPMLSTDLSLLGKLYGAFAQILDRFNPYVSNGFNELIAILNDLKDNVSNGEKLQQAISLSQSGLDTVLGMFVPRDQLGGVLPKLIGFLLEFQVLGLIGMAVDRLNAFTEIESFVLEGVRSLLNKNSTEAVSLFTQTTMDVASAVQNLANEDPFGNLRKMLAQSVAASGKELCDLLPGIQFQFLADRMVEHPQEVFPFEFSSLLMQVFGGSPPGAELMQQIAVSLHSRTTDPLLQYLCSGLCVAIESAAGYAAICSSLLTFQTQIEHLRELSKVLRAYFKTRFLTIVSEAEAQNAEIPDDLKSAIAPLKNSDFASLRSVLTAVYLLESVRLYVPESEKDGYREKLKAMERIATGQVFTIANALKCTSASLAKLGLRALEANIAVSERTAETVISAFEVVDKFSAGRAKFNEFRELLKASEKITSGLLPTVEQVITEAPMSLEIQADVSFAQVLSVAEEALGYFHDLQDALMPGQGIPAPIVRSTAALLVQSLYENAGACRTTEQRDLLPSLLSDVRLETLNFAVFFRLVSLPDPKKVVDLISDDLYQLDQTSLDTRMVEIQTELGEIHRDITTPPLDEEQLKNVNIRDRAQVEGFLGRVRLQDVRDKTWPLIHACLADQQNRQDIKTIEENLRSLVILRARDVHSVTLDEISRMSEQELFDRSIEIAAVLPYFAGEEQNAICELSQPLIARRSVAEVVAARERILLLLTYCLPLRQRVIEYSKIILTGQSVEPEIQETVSTFSIRYVCTTAPSQREKEFYNLMLFLANVWSARWNFFQEETVRLWVRALLQRSKISVAKVVDTVHEAVSCFIMTAVRCGCYNTEYMHMARRLLAALESYKDSQSEDNYRVLLGRVCQLPVTFAPEGQMTLDWAVACALIDPTPANEIVSINAKSLHDHLEEVFSGVSTRSVIIERKIVLPQEEKMESSSSSSSSSSDDEEAEAPPRPKQIRYEEPPPLREYSDSFSYSYSEDEDEHRQVETSSDSDDESESSSEELQPQVIYEDIIEEEDVGEPEIIELREYYSASEDEEPDQPQEVDSAEIQRGRAIEAARQAHRTIKELRDACASLEPQIISSRYTTFHGFALDIKRYVSEDVGKDIVPHLEAVLKVVETSFAGDRSHVSELDEHVDFFKKLKHQIRESGTKSEILTEVELLMANVTTILERIQQYPSEAAIQAALPLKRQIVYESRDILENMRALCRAIEKLLQKQGTVAHEKSLVKAVSSVSESTELFFLLPRMFDYDDDALKSKCSVACRRMQSGLTNMIMMMPGKNTQEEVEMKKAGNEVFSHLQSLLDFSSTVIGGKTGGPAVPSGVDQSSAEFSIQLSLKRLNAEAEVYKRRAALEEAQAEVERLNAIE